MPIHFSSIYRDFHLEQDPTSLHSVARAMMTLQSVYGVIPNVYGKGKAAKQVFDFMTRMRREMMGQEPQVPPKIDTLIVLDRQIDPISPLVTQLTYEGLIDEMFGIKYNAVKLPASRFMSAANEGSPEQQESPDVVNSIKTIPLHSAEEMYAQIRDKNFSAVGPALNKKAKFVLAQEEERHDAKTVRDLKLFVDKLPQIKVNFN